VKDFFDAVARRYDRDLALSGPVSRERLARMVREIHGKRRVLVLGLGTGRELPALLDAGHDVQGIELSRAMIAECNKRSRTVPIVQGDFYEPLPFPAGTFDAAVALHGTLAHPPRVDAHGDLANELARVLADGGMLYAEVPAAEGLTRLGVEATGPRTFVHRDPVTGIGITGVALTKDEWRAAFAPALAARVEPLNDLEYAIVASRTALG
jgi:SAM-dependent methyltransferase